MHMLKKKKISCAVHMLLYKDYRYKLFLEVWLQADHNSKVQLLRRHGTTVWQMIKDY